MNIGDKQTLHACNYNNVVFSGCNIKKPLNQLLNSFLAISEKRRLIECSKTLKYNVK